MLAILFAEPRKTINFGMRKPADTNYFNFDLVTSTLDELYQHALKADVTFSISSQLRSGSHLSVSAKSLDTASAA